jgi:3-dehydroquinate synthase
LENYGGLVGEFMDRLGLEIVRVIDSGEEEKSIDTVIDIWRELVSRGFTRRSMVIAFGGGVVIDVTGFAASTFMRGIYLVNIPTTLLSQADASIGAKNGVDFFGKNMVGTFYVPTLTIIDPIYLSTLPREEVVNGIVEVLKHGLIGSPSLLSLLADGRDRVLDLDLEFLEKVIYESVKVKLGIVSRDLREEGHRRLLNLGHTVGHAIEALSGYRVPHGVAVSQGLMVSMRIGERLLGFRETRFIERILEGLGLPTRLSYEPEKVVEMMRRDKKAWYGRHIMVIPSGRGSVEVLDVDEGVILEVLGELYEDMSIGNA